MELVNTLARGATAPARIGLSAAGRGLSVARTVVHEARRALDRDRRSGSGWSGSAPAAVPSPAPDLRGHGDALDSVVDVVVTPPTPVASPPAPEAVDPPPPVPPADAAGPAVPVAPPVPAAKEVDDEPVAVAEFAEPGAEDGAGAQVRVDPPWDGYDRMTAAEVRKRLAKADRVVAAAVALYEGAGKGRVSVVRDADRRLRALDA